MTRASRASLLPVLAGPVLGVTQPGDGTPGDRTPGDAAPGNAAPAGAARGPGEAADWPALPGGAARPDERRSRYCPVHCAECGAVVLAAKFSSQHTSVQWDEVALRRCAEFARRVARGEQTPLIERCEAMRASIEAAAREGRLPVVPP